MTPTLFDLSGDAYDERYLRLRDDPTFDRRRQQCDELWSSFQPYAEPTFKEEFGRQPQKRYWEMYLGAHVLQIGYDLQPKTREFGPDLCFDLNGVRVWIELTAVDEGTGADAVPKVSQHVGHEPIPDDKIILRFTNAISEKHKKLLSYLDQGLVTGNDFYIIGVNAAEIEMSLFDFDFPIPLIVKALYPLGDYVVQVDPEQNRVVGEGYRFRDAIQKESGADVPTNTFFDPAYSGVSGAIYSMAAFWEPSIRPVNELLYVHNKVAANSMPSGWMKAGRECWNHDEGWTIGPEQQFA